LFADKQKVPRIFQYYTDFVLYLVALVGAGVGLISMVRFESNIDVLFMVTFCFQCIVRTGQFCEKFLELCPC